MKKENKCTNVEYKLQSEKKLSIYYSFSDKSQLVKITGKLSKFMTMLNTEEAKYGGLLKAEKNIYKNAILIPKKSAVVGWIE